MAFIQTPWPSIAGDQARKLFLINNLTVDTPLTLLYQLVSQQIRNGDGAAARRMACRAALSPTRTLGWLAEVDRLCRRTGVDAIPFDLARKPGHSFLNRGLKQRERVHLLAGHYDRLIQAFGPAKVGALLRGTALHLTPVTGRSGDAYRIRLCRSLQNRREGELHLQLRRAGDDRPVASLALVVGAAAPGAATDLWIGGLQGCKDSDGRAVTVAVTKDLFGLRPKDMLVHAAYALGAVLKVDGVRAVSNASHVHAQGDGRRGWAADYDAFWEELGGTRIEGGYFRLPNTRVRRAAEEVPAAKRKAWRARHALLDALALDMAELGR
jgi:uncharacterized protein VirK/YbjX